MKLSIVIVSYNVRYFLEQALHSVYQSETDFQFEVCVVDNGSDDESVAMVKECFPQIELLETGENLGFAKANNIAARKCTGDYLLLLNPDTILKKDTLQKCIDFLEGHPDAGALGVKMYDGGGQFLPESKRGFPGPWTAFCKITGLNRIFPKSRLFNYYYLGHLSEDEDHTVDVLTGAFMMMKRQNYLNLNGLDEEFFMYGEDIDLCYRLHEQGFQNYYLASASIIHFKGESTSKHTVKYIITFYNAMSIYARKHYNKRVYKILSLFIQAAIYGRAAVAIFLQRFKNMFPIVRDFVFMILISILILWIMGETLRSYGFLLLNAILPISWSIVNVYSSDSKWWKSSVTSFIVFLLLALLSIFLSHSVLLWVGFAGLLLSVSKMGYRILKGEAVFLPDTSPERIAGILSDKRGEEGVMRLLDYLPQAPRRHELHEPKDIKDWIEGKMPIPKEIIFDPGTVKWDRIVNAIIQLSPNQDFRILSYDRKALITSLSKNQTAMIVTKEFALHEYMQYQLQDKRVSDCLFSIFVLFTFPYFLITAQIQLLKNAIEVLKNRRTWIGLEKIGQPAVYQYGSHYNSVDQMERAQYVYANDYSPVLDWRFLLARI